MQQGSTGNVIAALASFFLLSEALWVVALGWLIHIIACFEAAVYKGKISTSL